MTNMISAAFPYQKQRRRVLGREMACVEVGQGDPIVLLHGNPTSAWATPTSCLTVAPARIASSSTAATSAASCVYLTM